MNTGIYLLYILINLTGGWLTFQKPLYFVQMCAEPSDKTESGRKCCITDGVYMANVHKIAVATISRGIHFFDVATTNCFEQFHLFGIHL